MDNYGLPHCLIRQERNHIIPPSRARLQVFAEEHNYVSQKTEAV